MRINLELYTEMVRKRLMVTGVALPSLWKEQSRRRVDRAMKNKTIQLRIASKNVFKAKTFKTEQPAGAGMIDSNRDQDVESPTKALIVCVQDGGCSSTFNSKKS